MTTPIRRLEDRIRELCARVATASEHEQEQILTELQTAVTEYMRRADNKLLATIFDWPQIPIVERRKTSVGA
jgi:hypothetical protein